MANGTLKVENIQTSSGSGTITLGQSGETIALGSGVTSNLLYPSFMVFNNATTQNISNSVWTEVTIYDDVLYDTDSKFASSRFTPTIAGKYFFVAQIFRNGGFAGGFNAIDIAKNGSISLTSKNELAYQSDVAIGDTDLQVSGILELNTTDYVSVYMNQQTGGTTTIGSVRSQMFFGGYRIGA